MKILVIALDLKNMEDLELELMQMKSNAVEVLLKVVTDIDYIGACKKKSRFAYQTNMKELSKAIHEALLALERLDRLEKWLKFEERFSNEVYIRELRDVMEGGLRK